MINPGDILTLDQVKELEFDTSYEWKFGILFFGSETGNILCPTAYFHRMSRLPGKHKTVVERRRVDFTYIGDYQKKRRYWMSRIDKALEDYILEQLERIEEIKDDDEAAHIRAQELVEYGLNWIADNPHEENLDEVARLILRVYDIDFSWWTG